MVGLVDDDVKQSLCHCYTFDEEGKSKGGSFKSVNRDNPKAVDDAERREIVQAKYAELDEKVVESRSPNHDGGCFSYQDNSRCSAMLTLKS